MTEFHQAKVVAYRHLHEDGWEYYDAPTGEDCKECVPLCEKSTVVKMLELLQKSFIALERSHWDVNTNYNEALNTHKNFRIQEVIDIYEEQLKAHDSTMQELKLILGLKEN